MTFNEPWTFTVGGYSAGNHAPGCAPYQASELPCHNGDTAPYIVAHNVLNAHARASAIYRAEFQHAQGGKVSITYPCEISTGLTGSEADASAAEVANEFFLGWWLQPLVSGDYPAAMRDRVGDRLPRFSAAQSASLRKSIDVLSLNHYSTHLVSATAAGDVGDTSSGWMADQRIRSTFGKDWPASASSWQHAYPPGIRMLLRWASKRWKGPIFITENGWSCNSMSQEEAMHDTQQLDYFQNYTEQVREPLRPIPCSPHPNSAAGNRKDFARCWHQNTTGQIQPDCGALDSWKGSIHFYS
jgi:beta-glucosidase